MLFLIVIVITLVLLYLIGTKLKSKKYPSGITFGDCTLRMCEEGTSHRQFTFKKFRNEGYAKQLMRNEIETLKYLLNFISDCNELPINIRKKVLKNVMNILWKYVTGERINILQLSGLVESTTIRSRTFAAPCLRFIASQWTGYTVIENLNKYLSHTIDVSINKYKNILLVRENDFIYSFLDKIDLKDLPYTDEQLKGICLDILLAASANAGNTLSFPIISTVHNGGMREQNYQEIIPILGDEEPSWTDFGRLVYTGGIMSEVQRHYTVAPFSGPRRALTWKVTQYPQTPISSCRLVIGTPVWYFGMNRINSTRRDFSTQTAVWKLQSIIIPLWFGLVYTTAFLTEVQRYYTVAPFSGPRRALTDVIVDGYTIPSGTTILVSLDDLHFDPELWNEPNNFNPERFIDANGELITPTHLYPFGLGRRRCPGEALARAYTVTALVAIMKRYRIECSNRVLPSDEPVIGIFAEPQPFKAIFVKRE